MSYTVRKEYQKAVRVEFAFEIGQIVYDMFGEKFEVMDRFIRADPDPEQTSCLYHITNAEGHEYYLTQDYLRDTP